MTLPSLQYKKAELLLRFFVLKKKDDRPADRNDSIYLNILHKSFAFLTLPYSILYGCKNLALMREVLRLSPCGDVGAATET